MMNINNNVSGLYSDRNQSTLLYKKSLSAVNAVNKQSAPNTDMDKPMVMSETSARSSFLATRGSKVDITV